MRIAVIDDERPSRSELIHQILLVFPESEIAEADSGAAALDLISKQKFDVLMMDINLIDMEGTMLVSTARKLQPAAKLVFATAYSQYAVKAFELEVDNYILKPFVPERVRAVLEKCAREIAQTATKRSVENNEAGSRLTCEKLAITSNRKIVLISIADIVYLETEGRGCLIHTPDKEYYDSQLLGELERQLLPFGFFRIHKSYLVQLDQIAELFPWSNNSLAIRMKGFEKAVLPVGRERLKRLRQQLGL